MGSKLLLVDFENVQQLNLSKLDSAFNIAIYVGASQKSVPIELVTTDQGLGSRVEWFRVEGNGSNALDFYIAFHIGRILEKSPETECTVLSKDKGFDPLIKYLNKNKFKCRRINSQIELEPESKIAPNEEPNYQRVVDLLSKSEKKSRPRKRSTLMKHIAAMFQNKLTPKEVQRITDILFINKKISESNGTINYEF